MIAHELIIKRLRAAKFTHKRQAPRVDLWRQTGTGTIVTVPRCDLVPDKMAQAILYQAGLSAAEISEFTATANQPETIRASTEADASVVVPESSVSSPAIS